MKWIKRFFLGLFVWLVLMLIGAGVVYYKYRQAPSWYRPVAVSAAQRKQAASRADQKFADVFSWAAEVQARKIRQHRPGAHPDEPPIGPKTIVLGEDEINSFFERNWENSSFAWEQDLKSKLSEKFTEGRLVLLPKQIVLAGQSKDLGTLVSLPIEPSIDGQGNLWMRMQGIQAGSLPVPKSLLASHIDQLRGWMADRMEDYQNGATLDENDVANGPAVAAAMTLLTLHMLDDKPSQPVVFIPFDLAHWQRMLAVRITAISVSEGSLTMTLEELPDEQQAEVLSEIRRPYAASSAK